MGFDEVSDSERETGQSDRIKTQKSRTPAGSPKPTMSETLHVE